MIKSFPLGLLTNGLTAADFQTLAGAFAMIVARAIPSHPPVSFPTSASELADQIASGIANRKGGGKSLAGLYRRLVTGAEAGMVFQDMLLLALPLEDGDRQVAVASHVNQVVTARATADWLRELVARLPRELLAAKRLWLDHETALPNLECLLADLAALGKNSQADQNRRLLLVEAPPLAAGRDGFRQAVALADALRAFCRNSRLFHLGQCVFAVLSEGQEAAKPPSGQLAERSAAKLVWHLKNEGFGRVRVGSSGPAEVSAGPPFLEASLFEASLLDRAWTALLEARRRGRFGFCDFTALSQAQTSWWPTGKLLARFPADSPFAVLALSVPDKIRREILIFLAEKYEGIFIEGTTRPILIFLAACDNGQARQWARTMLAALAVRFGQAHFHAGIAVHRPDGHETLRAVVARAMKAIRHASYYGPGGIAAFDAVTCNIA
ncbi:MAG: hypothetical protein LBH14_05590, partial [Desulfobulbaceae bacterium]|nr:hypothetical protein [Desulfobulbaceae bacterium]